jgi:hypothetical protein
MALRRHGATASVHGRSLHGTTARDAKSAWRKSLLHREAMEPETSGTSRLERRVFNSNSLATSTCVRATARQSECALRTISVLQNFLLARLQILRKFFAEQKCDAADASRLAAARRCAMIPPGQTSVAKRGRP